MTELEAVVDQAITDLVNARARLVAANEIAQEQEPVPEMRVESEL
jgi:hypothetical protein